MTGMSNTINPGAPYGAGYEEICKAMGIDPTKRGGIWTGNLPDLIDDMKVVREEMMTRIKETDDNQVICWMYVVDGTLDMMYRLDHAVGMTRAIDKVKKSQENII